MLTWRRAVIVCLLLLPLAWVAPSYGDSQRRASGDGFFAAAETAPVTSLASVQVRTARERQISAERAHAESRQASMLSGLSVPRALEIAVHPMLLLALTIPWFWRRTASAR